MWNKCNYMKNPKNIQQFEVYVKLVYVCFCNLFCVYHAGSKRKILSTENLVAKAEIIRCLDIVDSSCLFSVTNRGSNKSKYMPPDSQIAKSYKQKAEKVKYNLQFGIAPWLRIIILKELKLLPFLFWFDQTTPSQIKKLIWRLCQLPLV